MTTGSVIPTSTGDAADALAGAEPAPRDPVPMAENPAVPRVLRNLGHGGHALVDERADATARGDGIRAGAVAGGQVTTDDTTPFGYLFADLAMPTGQAVCAERGVVPLTPDELLDGNGRVLNDTLVDGGFLKATPLWFYVLKEAEVREQGDRLGPVGGRIVAETILGQLRADAASFVHAPQAWDPGGPDGIVPIGGPDIRTIKDLLRFAGVLA